MLTSAGVRRGLFYGQKMERQKNTPEEISFEQLEKAVTASWPESQLIIGEHKLDINPLSLAVIYCPLYSKGPLEESGLIKYPEKMEDSRVAGKNYAYSKVISAINNCVKSVGGSVVLNSVFATKGVLLGNQPTEADYEALVYHQKIYLDFNKRISQETGIENHVLFKYDDFPVQFPRFVDPKLKLPREMIDTTPGEKESSKMISLFNKHLGLPVPIVDNKKSRKVIERVMTMNGIDFSAAFWLIGGYLAFDHFIQTITGQNGLYLVCERFEPLFYTAKLTPGLDELTRIQVKA